MESRFFIFHLCILSILALTFQPALKAQAETSQSWIEICTADGIELVNPGGPAQDKPAKHEGRNHCPLCLLRFAAILPQSPALKLPPPPGSSSVLHEPADKISFQSFRQPVQPRAPPSRA